MMPTPPGRRSSRFTGNGFTISAARNSTFARCFGSVTSRDIAEALSEQKVTVDAKKIHLDEPIKALGLTEVPIKLGQGVTAKIKVWVVKKE